MNGYTPVFGSLFKGSLCGQWPALPVFCTLLPLCDKDGRIDCSYAFLAAMTGWPEELLRQGIAQLEAPDPHSRSEADEGRRLIRLRDNTEWGWRVVNHSVYREKARKAAFDAARVDDGRNAERMRARREKDPTRPDATRDHPPSNTNTNTNTDTKKEPDFDPKSVMGLDEAAWADWVGHRKAMRKPIRPHAYEKAAKALAALGAKQQSEVDRAIANGWQSLNPDTRGTAKSRYEQLVGTANHEQNMAFLLGK